MPANPARVAICQPYIILGGRLQVILGIVRVLNEMGITPDILTLKMRFEPQQIADKYGQQLRMNFRILTPNRRFLPDDSATLLFNSLLHRLGRDYDLLINSSNSLMPLPAGQNILHYIHFPREGRILTPAHDLHLPDLRHAPLSMRGIQRTLLQQVYRFRRLHPQHHFVFNSEFSRAALQAVYPNLPANTHIVYPPVDFRDFQSANRSRERAIVSVGRFEPTKRQVEQVKLAAVMPDIPFHLIGFTNANNRTIQQCEALVSERGLTNMHLHPNESFATMIGLLQGSKYFLHTMINEPFGLTAVQAIAAGCVPIVHDSGGQRETVPLPQLRYQSLDEIPAIIQRLDAMPPDEIDALVAQLQTRARDQYDESVFHQKMRDILLPILAGQPTM
jgi:glycosyltransferase involved in cell wall biosynthesis